MKKQFLLGSALLATLCTFSQSAKMKVKPNAFVNTKMEKASYFKMDDNQAPQNLKRLTGPETNPNSTNISSEKSSNVNSTTINWKLLCGSMNVYGMLVSQSRPLQYNDNVNAVSFLHRKSATYTATPVNSNPGTIVAQISSNWGTTWDSTCIWANVDAGRYPQGAIYAGIGNTDIANAYVVGSGPTVNNNLFTGDWYASKKLAAPGSTLYNTTPDASPNAQQFLSFTLGSYPANQAQHGWSRYGFSSTDDGVVRSLALIEDDLQGLSTMRGAMVVKGSFNAGSFTWTTDSLVPNCVLATDGSKQLSSEVQMAWNEAGTVGYVVMPGALSTSTLANRGFQPIVYKTTNSGASWAQIGSIDFNAPSMAFITDALFGLQGDSTRSIPIFDNYDMTVDANNKLHIGAILASTFDGGNDSIGFTSQVMTSINPTEAYKWLHAPGSRPYLFDFIGDGSAAWSVVVVDSMSSEGPGVGSTSAGYNDNPWDPTGTASAKVGTDARIQLGRTPSGDYITFSWVESDTNFTNSGRKWNSIPNIKSRAMQVGTVTNTTNLVSTNELNVTEYPASQGLANAEVTGRATLHYMSPTTGTAAITGCTVEIKTPFTVTNSRPYSQLTNNTTWVANTNLSYNFCPTGISKNNMSKIDNSMIYPNPAKNAATLSISMVENAVLGISIYNIMGQELKSQNSQTQIGSNQINLDLSGLTKGVYLVKIQSGNSSSTKKLIIE